jgi:16S rRNA (uracil1498-N3)-methyltransferase
MARRYLLDPLPPQGPCTLTGDLGHHLATVLRLAAGDVVRLFDGRGQEADATVVASRPGSVAVAVGPPHAREPLPVHVHLAVALPRRNRAEWLFEHGTEVGVGTFHPIWCERARPHAERIDRWQRICVAAAGQCDRPWLPTVRPPRDLAELLADPSLPAARWLAAPGAPPLGPGRDAAAVLLVGPEGGFTADETAAIAAAGFTACGLGPMLLRTETAALIGAAVLQLRG